MLVRSGGHNTKGDFCRIHQTLRVNSGNGSSRFRSRLVTTRDGRFKSRDSFFN
jgi:hypothetical protein